MIKIRKKFLSQGLDTITREKKFVVSRPHLVNFDHFEKI